MFHPRRNVGVAGVETFWGKCWFFLRRTNVGREYNSILTFFKLFQFILKIFDKISLKTLSINGVKATEYAKQTMHTGVKDGLQLASNQYVSHYYSNELCKC